MEPTEEEIEALADELCRAARGRGPYSCSFPELAHYIRANFTRNAPVADDEVEALAMKLRQSWTNDHDGKGDSFYNSARHVLSRPAPPGTIRLGTGLTEAQKAYGSSRQDWLAEKYEAAATALMDVPWTETTDGMGSWSAVRDRLLKIATDLRAAAEPPVDPRIEILRANFLRLNPLYHIINGNEARAILAALDKMGGAGG